MDEYDPLKPSVALLAKLGSLVSHWEEFQSPHGHPYDKQQIDLLTTDPEVVRWLNVMRKQGYISIKR